MGDLKSPPSIRRSRQSRVSRVTSYVPMSGDGMAEFTQEMALKLKNGGEDGISALLAVAKIARDERGVAGIKEWLQVEWPVLPREDQDALLTMLVDVYLEGEGTRPAN